MSDVKPDLPESPYERWSVLRESYPVLQEEADAPYAVARYEDVLTILKDNETFSSDVSLRSEEEKKIRPSMLFSDPPVHNRLRKLVSYAFKRAFVENQRPLIEARCEELVGDLSQYRELDLVEALAAPLPVTIIAHMLGVVGGDQKQFKAWSDKIFSNIGEILYFLDRIAQLRRQPEDNLLGRLVETETEDGKLTDQEVLSFCGLLLIAGNETTTGLITASARVFHELPETFEQLKVSPDLIPTFVEETLRYYSPFSATIRRTTRDTSIAGTNIPKGALVLPLIASANRDESVFENADQFVIDRNPNPHIALGFGIHNCLGAHLARLEGQIAVASMTRHLKSICYADGESTVAGELGGPSSLRVKIEAA
jgi:cytochrome P450